MLIQMYEGKSVTEWAMVAKQAQEAIAALQADNRTYINERHENMKQIESLQAELEAAQQQLSAAQETILRTYTASAALDLVGVKAELERVKDQYEGMLAMVAALPKVEGEITVSNGYVKDSTRCHALFGADEDAASYAALLQHRQGMEGV